MERISLLESLLDSLKNPLVFVETDHVIRYVNKAAKQHYDQGETLVGSSILDCHHEKSRVKILEVFEAMKNDERERLLADDGKRRVFMRAVKSDEGEMIGYYERFEPSSGKNQGQPSTL